MKERPMDITYAIEVGMTREYHEYLFGCSEIVKHIEEYLNIMKDEPDEYILLSKVYHDLRRIIGDE